MLVRVLGPFEVEGDDGPVTLAGASQRAVLALLALHAGRPVGVPDLIDAVWPEDPPPSARNSLQSHVARLRARLGVPGLISLEPAGYRLNLARSCVDALRFEDLVRDAAAEAVSLWRGPPLPEFPAEPFRSAAVRLAALHRTALLRFAGSLPAAGAAAELRAAFDADPCWEEGAVALAGALATAGSRGDALEVLRRHADAVVERLGLDPSDQVRQAQLTLLRGAPLQSWTAAGLPAQAAGLPAQRGSEAAAGHPAQAVGLPVPAAVHSAHVADGAATHQPIPTLPKQRRAGLPPPHTGAGIEQRGAADAAGAMPASHPFPAAEAAPGAGLGREAGPGDRRISPGAAPGAGVGSQAGPGDRRISPEAAVWPGVATVVAPDSPRASSVGVPHGSKAIPLRFSSFLGRESEQRELAALLAEPGLVSVVGPGGVGKTRLVAETVRAVPRVAWVDAADVREADFLAAVAVGVGARVAPHEAPAEVIAVAAQRHLVVVLDNCEHVLSAAAELAEALRGVRVVVTSQESLRVDGERMLRLAPLAPDAARRLFCERARVPESPVVGEIVERLDLLPLAIELAATQAAVLGVTELHARLDDRLDLLSRGRRGGNPRHRTLRAVVEWSFGLLDPASARLLRRLAVFAGGFSVASAEAVAADEHLPRARVAALLAGLVDRSLVARHGAGRFRLLETVRAYANEQIAAGEARERLAAEEARERAAGSQARERAPAGEAREGAAESQARERMGGAETRERAAAGEMRELAAVGEPVERRRRRAGRRAPTDGASTGRVAAARKHPPGRHRAGEEALGADRAAVEARHAAAMAAAAEDLDARMRGPGQAAAVREIDALLPDLRLAYERGSAAIRVRLAAAMYRYGYRCQQYEVLAWGRAAVDGPAHPDALAAAATHAWGRGELDEARKLAAAAEPPGAPAHEVLGDVALVTCDAEAAIAHYRAMDGEPVFRVSGLVGEALVRVWSGQAAEAAELAGAAVDLADATGNPSARAEARYGLGEALGDTDPERALSLLDEAAALAASVDDRLFQAAAGTAAVAVRSRHGDPAPALAAFREVLGLWRRAGNDTLHAAALRNLVVLLVRVGADETATLIDAALPPARMYPAEAARLDRARAAAAERLGAQRVAALRRRGALLSVGRLADEAVRAIDAALGWGRG